MDAIYLYDKYGEPISYDLWTNVVRLIDWVCVHWREPDEGIWEVRGGRQEFLYSRVMCWVALDRAIRLAAQALLPRTARALARGARRDLSRHLHRLLGSRAGKPSCRRKAPRRSTPRPSSCRWSASSRPTDPRWLSTLRAIERDLVSDSLVYRYRLGDGFADGLAGEEGTFSMCSFWYVECLSRAGRSRSRRASSSRRCSATPTTWACTPRSWARGEHLGNFPQAFTHLALISAAYDLDRRLSVAGHAGSATDPTRPVDISSPSGSARTTLKRHGPGSVGVGHYARRHWLRSILQTVGVSGMRRLDELLIGPIGVGQIRIDRRRRVAGTRHTFEDDGSASVRVVREGRRPRGGLILSAICRRVLVGLKQFLIGPIVVGNARITGLHRLW